MVRRFCAVAVVAGLAFASASCSGDDDSTSDDATTVATKSPPTTDESETATTGDASAGDVDVKTIDITHAPSGVTVDGDTLWYTSSDENLLVKVDLTTGEETQEIAVGGSPEAVAVGAGAVWVTLGTFGDTAIARVDPATNEVAATIDVAPGDGPSGIVATDAGVWALVDGVGRTDRIDPATNTIAATVDPQPNVSSPGGGFIAATADAVWVVDRDMGHVLRIDPATNTVVATIDGVGYHQEDAGDGLTSILSQGPIGVATSTDGAVWVLSEAEGEGSTTTGEGVTVGGKLYDIDPDTNGVVNEIDLDETPASGSAVPKPGLAVSGNDGWVAGGEHAWHVDLGEGKAVSLLEDESFATYAGVAIGTDRVWFAAALVNGNKLFGIDPTSL